MKMRTEAADIYCLREFQDSISDSVHRVIQGSIQDRMKLEGFTVGETKITDTITGAVTTYRGAARNPDSIQSAQGYKYSWYEEAQRASQQSLDKLLPTILRNPGAECWFSANPQSAADPFSQRFITPYLKELNEKGYYEDDIHLIVVINWRDNPWWNKEQEMLRAWDYENQSRAKYDWIWEGKFNDTVDNAIIPVEWFDAAIDAHKKLGFAPIGPIIVAHDPSDTGPDDKGICKRQGSVILDVDVMDHGDVEEGSDWATQYALDSDADLYTWDGDGMGIALRSNVSAMLDGRKVDYKVFRGSESPDNPDDKYWGPDQKEGSSDKDKIRSNKQTFKNKRAQYYWKLRDRFYQTYKAVTKGKYIDPELMISLSSDIKRIDMLRAELCRIPRKPGGNGMIQIMSKQEMKKLEKIESPNRADALMMCMVEPEIDDDIVDIDFATEF